VWARDGSEEDHSRRTFAAVPGLQRLAANEFFQFREGFFELLRFAKNALKEIA
jgi:hypothetical protein